MGLARKLETPEAEAIHPAQRVAADHAARHQCRQQTVKRGARHGQTRRKIDLAQALRRGANGVQHIQRLVQRCGSVTRIGFHGLIISSMWDKTRNCAATALGTALVKKL